MSITAELDRLYETHFGDDTTVIRGGVADESRYTQHRTLVLLKEVNSGDKGWTLPQLLQDQLNRRRPLVPIWRTIGTFALGLMHNLTPYATLAALDGPKPDSAVLDALGILAATNLKKTGGGGQADPDEIAQHARLNAAFLADELAVLAPRIVICGGTLDILLETMGWRDARMVASSGAPYAAVGRALYIGLPHPAARVPIPVHYSHFRETVLNLMGRDAVGK